MLTPPHDALAHRTLKVCKKKIIDKIWCIQFCTLLISDEKIKNMPKQEFRLFRVFIAAFPDRVLEGYIVRTIIMLGKCLLLKVVSVHFSETSIWHLEHSQAHVWQCLPSQLFWYLVRVRPWPVGHLTMPLGGLAPLLLRMVPPNHDPDLMIKMKIHPHQTCIIRINYSSQIKAKLWSLTMPVSWLFFFWNEINGKIAPFPFLTSKPPFLKFLTHHMDF